MKTLLAAAAAETRRLLGTPGTLLLLIALPVLYPALLSWLYATNSALERPVLVVDDDHSAASRAFALALDATPGARVLAFDAPLDDARASLAAGDAELVVHLPAGHAARLAQGERATVRAYADSANMLTTSASLGALGDVVSALGRAEGEARWARREPLDRAIARAELLSADARVLNAPARAYGDFLMPAVLVVVLQQLVLLGMAFSAATTRERGGPLPTTLRGWLGFALPHTAAQALGALALVAASRAFGWPLAHPSAWLALALAFAVALGPFGALAASLAKDRASTLAALMFASAPSLLLSGYAWPTSQMPGALALLADAIPSTPVMTALPRLAYGDGDLTSLAPALQHLAILFAVGLALLSLRVVVLHLRRATSATAAPAA